MARLRRKLIRVLQDSKGASAVEFAIVAPIFVFIMISVVELSLFFLVTSRLDDAVALYATRLKTGQIVAAGTSVSASNGSVQSIQDIRSGICDYIAVVSKNDCINSLEFDVRTAAAFLSDQNDSPINGSLFKTDNLCFYSGTPGDIVIFKAYYMYQFANPLLYRTLGYITNYSRGTTTRAGSFFPIQVAKAFKSEMYKTQGNSGSGC